eukprot:SAG11_NODE_19865_length_457_cov_1.067039_1_plen_34_part_10
MRKYRWLEDEMRSVTLIRSHIYMYESDISRDPKL